MVLRKDEKIYMVNIFINIHSKKTLKEFEFIYKFVHELNKSYNEMPEVYSNCFIGLRLTENDGNANTVQEMGAMNIPVVHNGY